MAPKQSSLSHFFLGIILLAYGLNALQMPLLEVLHFMAHSPQIILGEYHQHSFGDHQVGHRHAYLLNIEESTEDDSPTQSSPQEIKIKKLTEALSSLPFIDFFSKNTNINFYFRSIMIPSGFAEIPAPPPKV